MIKIAGFYKSWGNSSGFTLIEVITVLFIMGVIAAVVIARGTATDEYKLKSQAEALKSHIRYVQMRAMNADPPTGGVCNAAFGISCTGGTYSMFKNCDTTSKVILPGAEGDTISTDLNLTQPIVTFDRWGVPYTDNNATSLAITDITLNSSENIIITKNTGFVP